MKDTQVPALLDFLKLFNEGALHIARSAFKRCRFLSFPPLFSAASRHTRCWVGSTQVTVVVTRSTRTHRFSTQKLGLHETLKSESTHRAQPDVQLLPCDVCEQRTNMPAGDLLLLMCMGCSPWMSGLVKKFFKQLQTSSEGPAGKSE